MPEMISLSNVTIFSAQAERGDRPILENFELYVEKGELAVLLAPSGSGKTTVVQLLTGERKPDAGEVWVNGVSIPLLRGSELVRYRRSLGIITQEHALLESRSVESQVRLPLEIEGLDIIRRENRVKAVLERFQLWGDREKLSHALSMGARRRTEIAMAVVREPMLLLADEPAAHLDRKSSKQIAQLLLHENLRGMTILIVTSDEHFSSNFPKACVKKIEEFILI